MTATQMLAGKRLVVIEDNPVVKMGLEDVLREAGAFIVRSFDQKADAAVLDVNLGSGISSLPIAARLNERRIPFVFYSGQSEEILAPVRKSFPTAPVISKPSEARRIVAEVAGLWKTR